MWPFSKRWRPPEPWCELRVGCASEALPRVIDVANPAGAEGAVAAMLGPMDAEPTGEDLVSPLKEGAYLAISPEGASCGMQIVRGVAAQQDAFPDMEPDVQRAMGLTDELIGRIRRIKWGVHVAPLGGKKNAPEGVLLATRLADAVARLAEGVVHDPCAIRFFGPGAWRMPDPLGEFDVREHVTIHVADDAERGGRWVHTHGLRKFGRPEFEIYGVPKEAVEDTLGGMGEIAQYVATQALIRPKETVGDPEQPFYARLGDKNKEDHWEDTPVLELVDVDEKRKPVAAGATRALKAFLKQMEEQGEG